MNNTVFWIEQQKRKALSGIRNAINRLAFARTVREVIQIDPPPGTAELRQLIRHSPEMSKFKRAKEKKAEELVTEKLKQIETMDGGARAAAIDSWKRNESELLRGNFPELFLQSERRVMALKNSSSV